MLWNFSHIKATQLSWLVQNCDPIMFPVKATHVLWSLDYKLMMSLWNGSKKHCSVSIIHVKCRYLNQCFVITSGTRAVSEWKLFLIGEITIGSQETMLYTRSTIHSPLPIWSKANTLFGRKPQGPHQQLWATSAGIHWPCWIKSQDKKVLKNTTTAKETFKQDHVKHHCLHCACQRHRRCQFIFGYVNYPIASLWTQEVDNWVSVSFTKTYNK